MPRLDGLELCRRLRARSEHLPILILSSKDEELDRIVGLELGADDYICKPYALRELTARVKALLRRARLRQEPEGAGQEQIVRAGELRLDLSRFEARWHGRHLALTLTEFNLLEALARRPGIVKSRAQLLRDTWPHDVHVAERTVDTHIKRLRKKLADAYRAAHPTNGPAADPINDAIARPINDPIAGPIDDPIAGPIDDPIDTVHSLGYRFRV
ncbi:MAG: DNA-binding response regulator [Acidobacteria bacterium]|nr:DNA-binding response regulator [Acidobacteriota bacterium]